MESSKLDNQLKVADLYHLDHITVRLFYFEAGSKLPQHAKTCREVVHILYGSKAKIGPIEEWIKDIGKRFYEFLPTAPQVIQVSHSSVIEESNSQDYILQEGSNPPYEMFYK